MLSDEDDRLGLFTAGKKRLQAYNYEPLVSNVGSAKHSRCNRQLASTSSSDSEDESLSSGHKDVSTDHRVHSTDSR